VLPRSSTGPQFSLGFGDFF